MMRKGQDRAGLHGSFRALQGIKELAGFGANLASNKFVRAAVHEQVRNGRQKPLCSASLVSARDGLCVRVVLSVSPTS